MADLAAPTLAKKMEAMPYGKASIIKVLALAIFMVYNRSANPACDRKE